MSAGVAERPLDGFDIATSGCVGSSGEGFGGAVLAQAVAAELQAMGVVDEAVENGVGERRLADQLMPFVDRDLAGDQRGAAAVAVFDDFEHVVALFGPERLEAPIVEDQQLDAAESAHQAGVAAVAASEREIAKHPRDALVKHRAVVTAGFLAEGTSKPAFADSGRTNGILPGVRDSRFGFTIPSTRAEAKPSPCSVRSTMLVLNT
jgi:hypothetical protein